MLIRQIMHKDVAEKYILIHVLNELAKDISHGKHEPLFRELTAYGDRVAGNSYHKFAESVSEYLGRFEKPEDMQSASTQLAATMRIILEGEDIEDENLSFLPCLTTAWFISETARNPLTTMTSLMLLDMIENEVFFDTGDGSNWYSWRNVLTHPQSGKTKDIYGTKVDRTTDFGGCHPMAHTGSFKQSELAPGESYTYILILNEDEEPPPAAEMDRNSIVIQIKASSLLITWFSDPSLKTSTPKNHELNKDKNREALNKLLVSRQKKISDQDTIKEIMSTFNIPSRRNIVRQKEGHLIIHWLQLMFDTLSSSQQKVIGLERVEATPLVKEDIEIEKLKKQLKNKRETIRKKKRANKNASQHELDAKKLEKQIENLEIANKTKEKIRPLIIAFLKRRLLTSQNLIYGLHKPSLSQDQLLYTDDHIRRLLEYYLPANENFTVIAPAASIFENPQLLKDATTNAVRAALAGQIVAMPIHLHGDHWVGAVFWRGDNNVIQVIYNDPMGNPIEGEPNVIVFVSAIQDAVETITPGATPNIIDLQFRQQHNDVDCGPFTVDNLVRIARNTGALTWIFHKKIGKTS